MCGDRQSKEPTLVVFAQSRKRRSESTRGFERCFASLRLWRSAPLFFVSIIVLVNLNIGSSCSSVLSSKVVVMGVSLPPPSSHDPYQHGLDLFLVR